MVDGDGTLLAMVRDARTGTSTELLRGVPSGGRVGALTATVYGLAHLVSAQDLRGLCEEARELRYVWRGEVVHALSIEAYVVAVDAAASEDWHLLLARVPDGGEHRACRVWNPGRRSRHTTG